MKELKKAILQRYRKQMVASNASSLNKFYYKKSVGFCHRRALLLRGFISKPTKRPQVSLENGTRDFQNGSPFKRSTHFYVTITGNFEHLQYFNFETSVLKKEYVIQSSHTKKIVWKRRNFFCLCSIPSSTRAKSFREGAKFQFQ